MNTLTILKKHQDQSVSGTLTQATDRVPSFNLSSEEEQNVWTVTSPTTGY